MIPTGLNPSTRRKTCPSATLPTTVPTPIGVRTDPSYRGERPANSPLCHERPVTYISSQTLNRRVNSGANRHGWQDSIRILLTHIPLGRPRHRWEDNIKMHIQEVGWWRHGLD